MQFKRLSDLDLKGKRVFIRSDLNVPQDTPATSPKTRASVPRCPRFSPRATPARRSW
jgi:phosphoglycerate kinase